jgi:bifunctional non-homologous end joining protein LigD
MNACKLGLEGIVSKKLDAPYKSGPSKAWLKIKNPNARCHSRY